MFLGAFTRIVLRWIIFGDKHTFDKLSEASQCVDLFLRTAEAQPKQKKKRRSGQKL